MARTRKKTGSGTGRPRKKKQTGMFGVKTCAVLVLLAAVVAFVFYVRSGGSLKVLDRVLPPALRLDTQPEQMRSWDADIFFSDTQSDVLVIEQRTLPWDRDPEQRAAMLMRELLRGPSGAAVRTTPETAVLRSVTIASDGTARADFSSQLASAHPGGSSSEVLTVYSIVNTLALNIDTIERVQILLDGRPADTIAGHLDCRQPFLPDIKIIK
jgi:spore germination protein GerM